MISRARFKLTGLAFLYGLVAWFALCSRGVSAQSGFQLKSGESVRTSSSVTADPAAAYGIGQYAFTRCVTAPGAPSSSALHNFGMFTSGAQIVAGIDAGSRWTGTNRQRPSTSTGGAADNFIITTSRYGWQGYTDGGGGGRAGFTAWVRVGHEFLTDAGISWFGVANEPGGGSCAADGWSTTPSNRPTGILVECPWDGGVTVLNSYTDAGKTTVVLGGGDGGVLTCAPGRGFDFVVTNAGGGSDVYTYTFTELDSGVSVSGTVQNNVEWQMWAPIFRTCNYHNATSAVVGIATACISSNF